MIKDNDNFITNKKCTALLSADGSKDKGPRKNNIF